MPRIPRRDALRRAPSLTQQELAESIAGPQLIALGREPRSYQVPQRLMRRIRYPHGRQIPRPITAGELLSISPVRLDPVASLDRHQRGGNHLTFNAELAQLPVQHVTGRSGLIAD